MIGLLLGEMAESSLIYTYQISGGQWSYLLERPGALLILALLIASLFGRRLIGFLARKARA